MVQQLTGESIAAFSNHLIRQEKSAATVEKYSRGRTSVFEFHSGTSCHKRTNVGL